MVEFAFDIKHLFPQPIIRVQAHCLCPKVEARPRPHPFNLAHHRGPSEPASCKLSQILDSMGQLSAVAQGLRHPVTTAEKLVATEQVVYLMADNEAGRWAVTALLKVGTKDLFLFDKQGSCRRADQTPAILDFYVHESRQRRGLGKQIFQRMLDEQGWAARKCSVDRPSEKLLAFLGKHYGLVRPIPQGNNFVLYEDFFEDAHAQAQAHAQAHAQAQAHAHAHAQAHTNAQAHAHANAHSHPQICPSPGLVCSVADGQGCSRSASPALRPAVPPIRPTTNPKQQQGDVLDQGQLPKVAGHQVSLQRRFRVPRQLCSMPQIQTARGRRCDH
ncbi:alpha-tubulin N-acetyltransferase 2 [Drosophila rhopaloa]|uniref:Alpha-tubulin N-acetyltransferase n=1 Tax=Drosophila rhopaloa TaxID=1041015 RepID=A0A6P4E249_DRORH|nr:alpha-tubulin N-acetyltransferase 2 [Drosophila rhopaloa]